LPGILSGITMVFIPTISTFAISQLLSDSTVFLFGDSIQMKFDQGLYGVGSVMSLVMIIIVLISNFVLNRFSKTNTVSGGRTLW
ncbi:MAG: ABC transporter permease, partial [Christensenellaceae bacterium]|nr:ABC transporter permease [Christensenellaceae bacterium]